MIECKAVYVNDDLIRFVNTEEDGWCVCAKDVIRMTGHSNISNIIKNMPMHYWTWEMVPPKTAIHSEEGSRPMIVLTKLGLVKLFFSSRKNQAIPLQAWALEVCFEKLQERYTTHK
jgi:prophage antirepressor-like protein